MGAFPSSGLKMLVVTPKLPEWGLFRILCHLHYCSRWYRLASPALRRTKYGGKGHHKYLLGQIVADVQAMGPQPTQNSSS